jgi:hypothetical protein
MTGSSQIDFQFWLAEVVEGGGGEGEEGTVSNVKTNTHKSHFVVIIFALCTQFSSRERPVYRFQIAVFLLGPM